MEIEFENELFKLRKNKCRNYESIQYLFLAINYDTQLNNNLIKIPTKNEIKEIYFREKEYDESHDKYFNLKNIKFVCINNLKFSHKPYFVKMMDSILSDSF